MHQGGVNRIGDTHLDVPLVTRDADLAIYTPEGWQKHLGSEPSFGARAPCAMSRPGASAR